MRLPPEARVELDNLEIQFGNKALLTLDDYSKLYGTNRRHAAQHLRRRGIPYTKEGREIYISVTDLAIYRAKRRIGTLAGGGELLATGRGFEQMVQRKRVAL